MEAYNVFSRFSFKTIKDLFPFFIIVGFINVWAYFQWIGRPDVFPLIINNVAGVIAVLITSILFFSVFSVTLLIPSGLCSLSALQKGKKARPTRRYNEGCCAITAFSAFLTAFTAIYFGESSDAWLILSAAGAVATGVHSLVNHRVNRLRQQHHRQLLARLKRMRSANNDLSTRLKRKFCLAEISLNVVVINLRYVIYAVFVSLVSFLPLLFLLPGDIYFSAKNTLPQYFIITGLYLLLFMPALFSLLTNKIKAHHGFKPILAFSPGLVLGVFTLFSVQLVQINQRAIEIVGMASWHEKVFSVPSKDFPAYYFPTSVWGPSKATGDARLITGIEAFTNGETHLICPARLKALRQRALKRNAFLWQADEKAKADLVGMSQNCLLIKGDKVTTAAVLNALLPNAPQMKP
ncbi:hypothetical protein TH59_08080 [Pantoea ananatis]|uniref:hypothetical protein n=1 Tax=Pantoea ananas TaxID=553 RepID=UPI0004674FA5|nr:hypothetical protein [Pantoea ananatis]MDC7865163.1 hypothetical protein [Pantoea ananatis]